MNLFFINVKLLVERLLPPSMRGDTRKAWLWSLHKPLQTFYDSVFTPYREKTLKLTNYNSQDLAFEKILNEELGITESPFIWIENFVETKTAEVFYNTNEGKVPVYFRNKTETTNTPVYFFNEGELQPEYDYIINVPSAVFSDDDKLNKIKELNEQIKLVGVNSDVISY